jgi:hypothetical protein
MHSHRRRGSTLLYAMLGTSALAGFTALAVDWGRVQLTKNELRAAADATARYGVAGLQNDVGGISAAYANATACVAQNKANGRAIPFVIADDMVIGKWTKATRTFTATTDLKQANAVKVTLRCTVARGNSVPMTFLSILGKGSQDVTAVSIAMIDYTGTIGGSGNGRYEYFIPATSNPWLAGMPAGTIASGSNAHNNRDVAGTAMEDDGSGDNKSLSRGTAFTTGGSDQADTYNLNYAAWGDFAAKKGSPIGAGGISVSGGNTITFDGVNGGANNLASNTTFDGDGNLGEVVWNVPDDANRGAIYGTQSSGYTNGNDSLGAENGIANVHAPNNSVIGIFLNDNRPSRTGAPEALDFSTAASRDFTSISPKLKQPFFIGDGRTSSGEVQQFVPPAGATRLFIGTMDEYEWSNNRGGFYVTAHAKGKIVTVK